MTDYKTVLYYLRDFSIDYAHLVYTLYPLVDFDSMKTITNNIESAFLVSTEIARDSKGVCCIKCKFGSPSEFLNFNHHIHIEYVGRVFSDFEKPRKYIEFQVPTPSRKTDRDVLYGFTQNYCARDIAATKQLMNDRYGIVNAEIKDYFPGYTYTPRRESQPKYFTVSSEGYSPIRCLPDIPNCVWPKQTFEQTETKTLKAGDGATFDYMFIKHYTNEPLSAGVAIVKEEKDMAEYKLKDAHSNLKLYMVEDKPTYTPRGMVRGTAHKVEELPEAIRNVQLNEKKGVVTVIWVDGDVTMAKCGPNDIWDPEKGLAIAVMKRWFKSTTSMNKWIKNTIPEDPDPIPLFQGLIRKAFGVKDDLFKEEKAEAVKAATESDRAEMLEKYESVKEENK